jgi:hypothetical protein
LSVQAQRQKREIADAQTAENVFEISLDSRFDEAEQWYMSALQRAAACAQRLTNRGWLRTRLSHKLRLVPAGQV